MSRNRRRAQRVAAERGLHALTPDRVCACAAKKQILTAKVDVFADPEELAPKGRNENGPYRTLADWVRPKNMYGKGGMIEEDGRYHAPGCACVVHEDATTSGKPGTELTGEPK